MKQELLKDKVKDFIGNQKVKAAVFLSYNFDTDFFENYLLPLFVPKVNFTDNKIQNALLWRRYAGELPPVTVVCDFHAKGPIAPNLNYDIFTLGTSKQCFHVKHSFILMQDGRLMIITGSNNLTWSAWCHNIEIFSILAYQTKTEIPQVLSERFYELLNRISHDIKEKGESSGLPASGIKIIRGEFKNESNITENSIKFWHAFEKENFKSFLEKLTSNDSIEQVEIISPYIFGDSLQGLDYFKTITNDISIAIPYSATEVLGIKKEVFEKIEYHGIKWKTLVVDEESKHFRFNHSKIYRLKGKGNMYTVIGSVNLTDPAWKGAKEGNIESAIAYIEKPEKWKDWLIECNTNFREKLVFDEKAGDEFLSFNRKTAPTLSFTIDWESKTLNYQREENDEVYWWLIDDNWTRKKLTVENNSINLIKNKIDIDALATNPVITVLFNNNQFTYYPKQIGFETKPLPPKYRLQDQQIFQLWNDLEKKPKAGVDENKVIDKLAEHFDSGEDYIEQPLEISSLNQMATHLTGLITLEKALFPDQGKPSLETINYYLFTENIDTLPGYMKLIKEMKEKTGKIQPGFYWLILNIIQKQFYQDSYLKVKLKKSEKSEFLKHAQSKKQDISSELKTIKKDILEGKEGKELKAIMDWITKQL
jgi:HKD family nuclease